MKKSLSRSIVLLALTAAFFLPGLVAAPGERREKQAGLIIVCQLSYTPATGGDTKSEQRKVRVDLRDADQALRLGDTVEFKDMAFSTRYAQDYLAIDIVDLKTRKAICRQVYNFGKNVTNQFEGADGFTGLVYAFHPESRAELQFYCTRVEK